MIPTNNKKEKILAVFTVIFLFIVVGSLLFLISLNNKKNTDTLRLLVREQQARNETVKNFQNIQANGPATSTLTSKSYLSLAFIDTGTKKNIQEKNPNLVLPIASITKLMVGVITLENIDLETEVTATVNYIGREESAFVLEDGKTYKTGELLMNALISSDNDSARLLSSILGENNFIDKMNTKAAELGMTSTHYANVTGLDPATSTQDINTSTVTDLANLLSYIIEKHPDLLKITTKTSYNVCDINNYCKLVTNTDKLLGNPDFRHKIIGGKTGSTDLAGKNLALVVNFSNNIFLINIVLGSENSFFDTTSLINNIVIK